MAGNDCSVTFSEKELGYLEEFWLCNIDEAVEQRGGGHKDVSSLRDRQRTPIKGQPLTTFLLITDV